MAIFVIYTETTGQWDERETTLQILALNENDKGLAEANKLVTLHPDARVIIGAEKKVIPTHIEF